MKSNHASHESDELLMLASHKLDTDLEFILQLINAPF